MTKEALKIAIKEKFGTISNFSRISGIHRTRLQIMFAKGTKPTDDELERMQAKCDELEPKETGDLIDPVHLEALRQKITEWGGAYKFCQDNPRFTENQVYPLIQGKRKRNSAAAKRLFKFFKIK